MLSIEGEKLSNFILDLFKVYADHLIQQKMFITNVFDRWRYDPKFFLYKCYFAKNLEKESF